MRKLLIVATLLLAIISSVHSQEHVKTFKISHKNKQKRIYCKAPNHLEFIINGESSTGNDTTRYLIGKILDMNNNTITVLPHCDIIDVKYLSEKVYYNKSCASNPMNPLEIKISDISKIEYKSKSSENWSNSGSLFIAVGSLTALIVAPLISIDYSNGDFNSQRYYNTAALGLGLVTVGIPLRIIFKKKTYHFKPRDSKKRTKVWNF